MTGINMNSTRLCSAAAAIVLNIAVAMPAHAQVKAALTRDVDRPTSQPVKAFCSTTTSTNCGLYSVPAGKRLVVETVSYYVTTVSGGQLDFIAFGEGEPNSILLSSDFYLTPMVANDVSGSRAFAATQALLMYVDEGHTLAAQAARSSGSRVTYGSFFGFSGYLVDK